MRIYLPEFPISHNSVLTGDLGWFPGEPMGLLNIRLLSFTDTSGQFVIFALRIIRLGIEILVLSKD